ncbi:lactate utilization protein [Desulfobacterales bacterium HSG16]|nr:lactate utilization protein [Desulfobacterales bacterium HSG16]
MKDPDGLCDIFKRKAMAVSAIVKDVDSLDNAFEYAIEICKKKEACKMMNPGFDSQAKSEKIISAPGLSEDMAEKFADICMEQGIDYAQDSLRNHLSGIDIGFTTADWGIAETGTLVIDSSMEELRLATMISEIHIAVLQKSRIVKDSYELEDRLIQSMQKSPNYMAFITGASRTADIERVLAIGVHGPLELHILMLEDL